MEGKKRILCATSRGKKKSSPMFSKKSILYIEYDTNVHNSGRKEPDHAWTMKKKKISIRFQNRLRLVEARNRGFWTSHARPAAHEGHYQTDQGKSLTRKQPVPPKEGRDKKLSSIKR